MLFLINPLLVFITRRHPLLGVAVGLIAAAAVIAIGVATKQVTLVVTSVVSLAASFARLRARRRSGIAAGSTSLES